MCKWCADQTVPSHKADRTRPATQASCPVCRKRVKQKVSAPIVVSSRHADISAKGKHLYWLDSSMLYILSAFFCFCLLIEETFSLLRNAIEGVVMLVGFDDDESYASYADDAFGFGELEGFW